ncbi:MAG: hypothetical protein ACOY81_00880 [Bacillota bacterium]|uniref:hypothetical protein n=1 Tax=Desulfurispora thermophila TaxID=265470 RepID=UPI000369019D|nr:hypothetical protein [Desulfurispora thermophila]
MTDKVVSLEEKRLKEILAQMYRLQMENFFSDGIMPALMDKAGLSEEQAIQVLQQLIERGYLCTGNFKARYFLRPGYVHCFPVVISAQGLSWLKCSESVQ